MIAALLTTFLFSLTAVFATQSAHALGPEKANLGRLLVALILLGTWSHLFGGGLGGGQLPVLMAAGAIGFGAGGWCMFQAFPRIGSTLSLLVVECTAALLTTVLAWWRLGASLRLHELILVVTVISGLILALGPSVRVSAGRKTLLSGIGFAALAAVGQSISWVLTKSAFTAAAQASVPLPAMTAAYQRLLGGVVVAVMAFLIYILLTRLRPSPSPALPGRYPSVPPVIWVTANAVAGPVLGVSCMLWAIREVGNPGLVQSVVATATLFTVPLARHFERRIFRINYFIGSGIALAGVSGLLIG